MQLRRLVLLAAAIGLVNAAAQTPQANAQAGAQQPAGSDAVIKTETRVVLVDAVVTGKKGEYIRDLTAKDFRVFEDNNEQKVTSFSFEADPDSPANSQKRYLVLFFDNSTMDFGAQARARDAAAKFIDANTGPNRLMAIVNYGGTVQLAQNFTADTERLKQIVAGVKFSHVSPDANSPMNAPVEVASLGMPSLGNAAASFGVWDELLALRSMAKNLASVPGRKSLVLFTAGFRVSPDNMSELTAAIDACNKANVAVYAIDVRGLVAGAPMGPGPGGASLRPPDPQGIGFQGVQVLRAAFGVDSTFGGSSFGMGSSFLPQHGGGGGGGGTGGGGSTGGGSKGGSTGSTGSGSTGSGSKGGSTGGSTGGGKSTGTTGGGGGATNPNNSMMNPYALNPYAQSRLLIPPMIGGTGNQDVLYALATGTGGFVIVNTNDLSGGLDKIGKELNEFYLLGYTPLETPEGSCHSLKVKVDRAGTTVRSRSGYCNIKAVDLLAGNPVEKNLENVVKGTAPGIEGSSMSAPFFYSSANTARVDVAIEIPSESVKFVKSHGKFHAEVNVLGIAYRADGGVAARFSDTVKLDMENKKEVQAFAEQPMHYENQFDIASGQYKLKVAFSSAGAGFGKLEMPLSIDPYDDKQFSLSAVALSKQLHRVADLGSGLDEVLIEGHTPLVVQGMQITPSGTNRFKKTDQALLYVEIYEPHMSDKNPPVVGLQLRVLDRKTKEQKEDSGMMGVNKDIRAGNPVIPVGLKLPVNTLIPGSYVAELQAKDSAGNTTVVRAADFEVE
jgi:VWFA-related protein